MCIRDRAKPRGDSAAEAEADESRFSIESVTEVGARWPRPPPPAADPAWAALAKPRGEGPATAEGDEAIEDGGDERAFAPLAERPAEASAVSQMWAMLGRAAGTHANDGGARVGANEPASAAEGYTYEEGSTADGGGQVGGLANWFQLGRSKPAVAQRPYRLYTADKALDETCAFERADAYAGPREGRTFKTGPQGLGYYEERGQWVTADARYHHVPQARPAAPKPARNELPNFRGGLVNASDVGLNAGLGPAAGPSTPEGSRFMTFGPAPADYSVYRPLGLPVDDERGGGQPARDEAVKSALPPMRFGNYNYDDMRERAERFRKMMLAPSLGGAPPVVSPKASAEPLEQPAWNPSLKVDDKPGRSRADLSA